MLHKKGKRGKTKQEDEDYTPKAFQRNKKKEEKNETKKNSKKSIKTTNRKKKTNKKKTPKRKLKKVLLIAFTIAIIYGGISLVISANRWNKLAKQMLANENSIVIDIDGNKIATLGCEKNNLIVPFNTIPKDLKNAYVSIEDERFYNHKGIDIKRTGRCYFILYNSFWEIILWRKYYYTTVN